VALNRDYGIVFGYPFIDPKLQKDKRLVLSSIQHSSEACNRSHEILSELPKCLRQDKKIALAAVEKRGSNLCHVDCPFALQDFDLALAACQQDGASIIFVPDGVTKQRLLGDPEYAHIHDRRKRRLCRILHEQEYDVEAFAYIKIQNCLWQP